MPRPGVLTNYFAPDDHSDPRRHYGMQYVRDFTYTFTMASDVPALQLANGSDAPGSGFVCLFVCVCNRGVFRVGHRRTRRNTEHRTPRHLI